MDERTVVAVGVFNRVNHDQYAIFHSVFLSMHGTTAPETDGQCFSFHLSSFSTFFEQQKIYTPKLQRNDSADLSTFRPTLRLFTPP